MDYETFKKKMSSGKSETMKEMSKFYRDCPALYNSYKEQWQQEQEREQQAQNRKLMGM